ncbi:MAG: translocation/assembly module TamB domain-containing protein [Acetobacteraceae bacterium]|nr:translocation/assembly module TamB domain-containing protein [Acetobacteraceae bacterium]
MRVLKPVVLAVVVLPAMGTGAQAAFGIPSPTQLILDLVGKLSGGAVHATGVSGWPNALHVDRLELRDADGAWLIAEDVTLDWHPYRLAEKEAAIDKVTAARLSIPRLAASSPGPAKPSSGLPVSVDVKSLHVDRVEIGAPVAGAAGAFSLDGSLVLPTLLTPTAHLHAVRLDGPGGQYNVDAVVDDEAIDATVAVAEPPNGFIAEVAKLPDLGALDLYATVKGPRTALDTKLALAAGQLKATADGTVDLTDETLDLHVNGNAPAMKPAPEVSWHSIALTTDVKGPFTKPDASGHLEIDQLAAAGATVRQLTADLAGNEGRVTVHAAAAGLEAPLPKPDLLAAAPLTLDATVQLDDKARPVTFKLAHPLFTAAGTAQTAGSPSVAMDLTVPQLDPFTQLAGVELHGHTNVHLDAAQLPDSTLTLTGDGTLAITSGLAPLPGLIGDDAKVGLTMRQHGQGLTISRMTVDGRTLQLALTGGEQAGKLTGHIKAALSNLSVVAPTLEGNVATTVDLSGTQSDLALKAHAQGDIGAPGVPRGPVTVDVVAKGLPSAPSGTITAEGRLAGAPLALAVDAERAPDGAVQATIKRADWRSLHADGALQLPAGSKLPLGHVQLHIGQLSDFRPFTGQALSGSVNATLDAGTDELRLKADASGAGVPGSRIGSATLAARVHDPLGTPSVTANADLTGIEAAGVSGSAKIAVNGPQTALAIRTNAALSLSGTPAQINGAALLDVPAKSVRLNTLEVLAKGETARLLAPATVRFGGPVSVDRLRVGLQGAVLDVAGQVSPRLDATVTVRAPASLASVVSPDLKLAGTIAVDAKLTGTPALPGGTVRVNVAGLQMLTGPGRAIPPANLNATAALNGKSAQVDARLSAGSARFNVAGRAPLGAGPLALRATGGLDLTLLDPILTANGRRVRGRLTLDGSVDGTTSAPRVAGTAQLANGEVQDFTQGLRITNIAATIRGEGDTVRIVSLTGRAGQGTISASGTVGVTAPGLPVDLTLQARDARPISSDTLQLTADANLTVRGRAQGDLEAGGRVLIRTFYNLIRSCLPPSWAWFDVLRPGHWRAAPPAGPAPTIGLNLVVDAPGQIFVRGRGVDAELSGELRIQGSASKPKVAGGFEMRRGAVSLAGTTLAFSRGKVGFDGTGPGGKIDPSLDFVAESSTTSVTATLTIGGYASAPTIKLTSTPPLPQDEVLSYLLFRRSLKDIGPFQIASIAASLAELTGVGGGGANPLDKIRNGLGLDRLSVGGTSTGSGASVEAGRYLANGVYLGAKQGTSGDAGTGATLQIDITKGLKVETDVGSGRGGNSVGLTYQYEY